MPEPGPAAVDVGRPQAPIDIEALVRWALQPGRTGGLAWRDEAALSFDRGVTARPRRRARGSWSLVIAGAGRVGGTPRRIVLAPSAESDAELVIAAIRALPAAAAALVIQHGRHRTRPGWTDRVEERSPRWAAPGRPVILFADPFRRAQPFCPLTIKIIEMITERAISRYSAWWEGLATLVGALDGRLRRWRVSGFAAPERPWLDHTAAPRAQREE